MAQTVIPDGLKGKDLYQFLIQNKSALVAQKKMEMKRADPVFSRLYVPKTGIAGKAIDTAAEDKDGAIQRLCVINTTNWLDSHGDVHIPGIWKKSLADTKALMLLQEHKLTFEGIITDEVNAYTQTLAWSDLGVDSIGTTEALIFSVSIPADRNPYMFDQYRLDRVKNHSVGMCYVNIQLAVNDEDWKEEFATWNTYYPTIANKEAADQAGYFWAVREAKVFEGSAVPIGSNIATPTLSQDTQKQPLVSTVDEPSTESYNVMEAIKSLQFFNN